MEKNASNNSKILKKDQNFNKSSGNRTQKKKKKNR